jgi:hypothetical protein
MGILTGGCRHRPDTVHQVDVGGFEVYGILGRDFDSEHDEYIKLILENRDIIKSFQSVSRES